MDNNRKQNNSSNIFLYIIIIIIVYIGFKNTFSHIGTFKETIEPEFVKYQHNEIYDGIFMKKEEVYKLTDEIAAMGIPEGKRIPAKFLNVNSETSKEALKLQKELLIIDNKLGTSSENLINNSFYSERDVLFNRVQNLVLENSYYSIYETKKNIFIISELDIDNNDNESLEQIEDLDSEQIKELQKEREELISKINNISSQNKKNISGIVSYAIDGFETKYNIDNFDFVSNQQITEDFKKSSILENSIDAKFKVVDNFKELIVFSVPKDKISLFINEQNVNFSIGKSKTIYKGKIVKSSGEYDSIFGIEISDKNEEIYPNRFIELNIILNTIDSFKIPSYSLIKKDGHTGVIVKNINGIAQFKPVNILSQEGNYIYVEKGDIRNRIILDEKEVTTLSPYEEIFINPTKISIGDIID